MDKNCYLYMRVSAKASFIACLRNKGKAVALVAVRRVHGVGGKKAREREIEMEGGRGRKGD